MAFLDETGLAHFWNQIIARLNKFVPAEAGKGLSSNDYTTEEKEKLAGIETGANKTIVDSALSSTSTNPVQNSVINAKFDSVQSDINGKVPSTRTVNGKALSSNITLSASDVGASTSSHNHAGMSINPSSIELNPGTSASHGGYIDFYYQGSSNDYTSRIIEDASGKLSITASNGVYIGGNKVYHAGNQQVIVSNTQPTTQVAGDLWYKVV